MRDFKGTKRQRGRNRGTGGPSGGNTTGGSGGQGGKPSQNINRAFDSNGPDGIKVRGHAQSVYEKYQQLARDAFASGDRVLAENHLQHAEHYFRVLRLIQPQRSTSEIVARDVFASGFDIDFEDEGEGEDGGSYGSEGDGAAEARSDERDSYGDRPRIDQQNRNDQVRGDQNRGDQNRGDQTRSDQSRNDRERNDRDRRDGRFGERQNGERQNGSGQHGSSQNGSGQNAERQGEADRGERQNGERQNGERQNGRGARQDRPRYEGRRDERAGGYGEQPREFGRDRSEVRAEPPTTDRAHEVVAEAPRLASTADPARSEPLRADPLPLIEPEARSLTPPADAVAFASRYASEPAAASPVLRSVDGGVSEAPAFLQAFAAPASTEAEMSDEPAARRPRGRPRKRPADTDAEDNAPAPASGPEEA